MNGAKLKIFIHIFASVLLTPLPIRLFTTEEITGCTNEAANNVGRNPPSCFFYFMFYCFSNTIN